MSRVLALVAALLLVAASASAEPATARLRRFALVAGANDGGPGRARLRHAGTDADAMARVLGDLGGVAPRDLIVLKQPGREAVEAAFGRLAALLSYARTQGLRAEVVFYYSGHSDEEALLLGAERYSYKEVRGHLESLPADVRVAIVDSCASGALTQAKGGKFRPPFAVDEAAQVRGYAILTSASATENAQESDRIGGSYFTHFLVSGLRGAADVSRDGRVTLTEAYDYAFSETLARTSATLSGPQHPNYEMRLAGAGELVLTDLRVTSAVLVLAEGLDGRVFLRDAQGRLVAEVNKPAGRTVRIGLEPGAYEATLERPAVTRRGTVEVAEGRDTVLKVDGLAEVPREVTTARGGPAAEEEAPPVFEERFFSAAVVPGVSTNGRAEPGRRVRNSFSFNLLLDDADTLSGVELSGIGALRGGSVTGFQASGVFNLVTGRTTGLQLAGGVNVARGGLSGVQWCGGANVSLGDSKGLQLTGGANVTTGAFRGLQIAAGANWAGPASGVQVAAGVNVARDLSGVQVGMANVGLGRSGGVQIGVVNVSPDADFALGPINIVWNGRLHVDAWFDSARFISVAIKHGGRHFHYFYGLGVRPRLDGTLFAAVFGLGGHVQLPHRLHLDIDLVNHAILDGDHLRDKSFDNVSHLRAVLGWSPVARFAIFAGPAVGFQATNRADATLVGFPAVQRTFGADTRFWMWPGFAIGVQGL